MDLIKLHELLSELIRLKSQGGGTFSKIAKVLEREATTVNIAEAYKLLLQLKGTQK
jgi:hypothetical protein